MKRKACNDFNRSINELVYKWFNAQGAKTILQTYACKVVQELGDESRFNASNR